MLCAFYQAFYVSSEQDIDGECLISLTEKQIDALKLSIGHSAKLQKLVTNLNVENVNQPSTIQVVLQNQEKGVNQIEDARQSTSIETNQSEQIQVGQLQVWNDVK
jgi:hypothetical protein